MYVNEVCGVFFEVVWLFIFKIICLMLIYRWVEIWLILYNVYVYCGGIGNLILLF